jgi:rod shape determining protein RodA
MTELIRRITAPRFDLRPQERTLAWRLHIDLPLLIALILVSLAGLFVLYSATGEDSGAVINQAIRLGVGFLVMLVFAQIPPRTFSYWSLPLFLFGAVLLVLVSSSMEPSAGCQCRCWGAFNRLKS